MLFTFEARITCPCILEAKHSTLCFFPKYFDDMVFEFKLFYFGTIFNMEREKTTVLGYDIKPFTKCLLNVVLLENTK